MACLHLKGLVAAPHTPFHADGTLNLAVIEKQAQLLVEGRTSGAFVCGTTGERRIPVNPGANASRGTMGRAVPPGELPVIVHVGHTSIAESRALAAHAQTIGAAAISALSPYFFKPGSVTDLVEFCAQVAAAAPGLPFYDHHLPAMTGVTFSMVELIRQARDRIPTFAGIKFTHNDLKEFQQCLRLAEGSLDILFGRDEILMHGFAAGARGAVGSTYNYAAPVYLRLIEAIDACDLTAARECQAQAVRMIEVLRKYGEIPTAKAIMTMLGVPCGPARTPLPKLTDRQTQSIFDDLAGLDIFVRPLRLS